MIGCSILTCGLNTRCFDDNTSNQSLVNSSRNQVTSDTVDDVGGKSKYEGRVYSGVQGADRIQGTFQRSVEVWDESLQYSQSFPDETKDNNKFTSDEAQVEGHGKEKDPVKAKDEKACTLPCKKEQVCLGDLLGRNTIEGSSSSDTCPEGRDDIVGNGGRGEQSHLNDTERQEMKGNCRLDPSQSLKLEVPDDYDNENGIPPYARRETFTYLTRETKPEVLKNSTKADILRSFMKRDQQIAIKRKEALLKTRATATQNRGLPGKKTSYPSNYVTKIRQRQQEQKQVLITKDMQPIQSSGPIPTKLDESPPEPTRIDKVKQREMLRSLTKRNQEIAKTRQERIQKARERINGDHVRKLPGRKMDYPEPLILQDQFGDDFSVSSNTSSRSTSTRLDRLYEKGKKDRRSDLEKSARQKKAEEDLKQRAERILARRKDVGFSKEAKQNRMYELIQRNKDFAMKRRSDMENARKNGIAGPTIRGRHDENYDSDSVSVTSASTTHSTLTSSSRLNRLYEEGKQKRLSDLRRSIERSRDIVLDVRKVEPTNMRCNKLYELSKRKHLVGRKRRQDIANAKIEAMRAMNQMHNDDKLCCKKNIMTNRQQLSSDWYFSNTSLKNRTVSTEDEKMNDSEGSNESNSSSDSNTENTYNYEDFILRNYQGDGNLVSLK